MAQKRFLNWKDAVKTFEIGEANLGKLQPGRYAGFDSIISAVGPTSGVLIDLIHTTTGFDKTLENGSQTSNNAALVMPTGTIIHEDAPITSLDIESNLTNPDYRFDYIICEHEYVQSVGGTPATYSVIKGPLLAALPTIPNPDKQILIGVVRVDPGNDTDFSGLTYTKEPVPLLGNETLQEFRDKLELATKTYIDKADAALQDNIDAITYPETLYDNTPTPRLYIDTLGSRIVSLWSHLFQEVVTFIKQLNINNGAGNTGRIFGNTNNELEIESNTGINLTGNLKMVKPTFDTFWQKAGLSTNSDFYYFVDESGTSTTVDTWLPSRPYDRVVNINGWVISGANTLDIILILETVLGGTEYPIGQVSEFGSMHCIIPANCRYKIRFNTLLSSANIHTYIQKLGL